MSDIIRLLPDHVANQIAAGEVVQRPASVVKELVENSIDAGATKIELHIKDAGRTLIQIVDNGKGMSPLDARMSFERHATSKIANADDLFALKTKGFRGEALASIAAIAHVTLQTKRATDELGTKIVIEGTQVVNQEPTQCAVGCNFEIKNLFFNVPARRNFLKSDNVEFKHIIDEFERVVLPHHDISFRLVHNDQEIYHLSPGPLRKRIVDVFGKKFTDHLVPVTEQTDIVELNGFVGKPEVAKKSRGEQFLFVNNRFFKDTYFNHAISAAFEHLLPSKLFPSYFLFLDIDPKQIDVNVHPTKTEIKFEEDKAIYSIIRSAVRLGLGKFNITPTLDFERETEFDIPVSMIGQTPVAPEIRVDKNYNPFHAHNTREGQFAANHANTNTSSVPKNASFSSALNKAGFGSQFQSSSLDELWNSESVENELKETQTQIQIDVEALKSTGPFIVKGSFVISSVPEGLLVFHYRRIYERLLYNDLMRGFFVNPLASQQLIFPMEKKLSKQEQLAWNEHEKTLSRIGFNWKWEQQDIHIHGIPEILDESTVLSCVDKILEQLQMGTLDKGEIAHTVLSQIAFAGSMSFKIPNDQQAIADYIARLFESDEHTFSPSGKRIIAQITNEQIIQLF
ncbi:DNA mismatch repair endonuclease MutL [Fluviicola taffensis]|uniref:DNA mismatch repair protein MutL n=1 Tax=Fluviicola taffensis (strain DSM 16823 / NCIMB 13979 / RW262) TaxID=755732 RepID=F2ID86_FLUTR|nr:DNA mismatch repair endonuclease MutL [Fluviicola taffensis]AEA45501.1 DNA mismatch repair protein mutL [Fluviicola taffensis DSM 16823]